MTNVPANMSPRRLPFADSSDVTSARNPNVIQISSTAISARTSAWRKRSGPPSSLTTRSPSQSFPRDFPLLSVSKVAGYPTMVRTTQASPTAAAEAGSKAAAGRGGPCDQQEREQQNGLGHEVDDQREHPAGEPRDRHIEDDSLTGDDFVHASPPFWSIPAPG